MTLVKLRCQDCGRRSLKAPHRLEVDPGHPLPIVRSRCFWCRQPIEVTVDDGMAIALVELGAVVVGPLTSLEIDEFTRELESTDLLASWIEDQ